MSNIRKWGYINKAYSECSRSAVLRKRFSLKKISTNYVYWLLAGIYSTVSLIALCFSQTHFFYSVLSISLTALLIYYFSEVRLSKDLCQYYEPHGLHDHPLFSRPRYLNYLLFKEKLEKDHIIHPDDIDSLIAWDEINNEKIDRSIFFKSKWFLIILTGVIGVLVQYLLGLKPNPKELALAIYIIFVLLWFSWIVFDFTNIAKEKDLNIYRFLKWFKLESEKA